MNLVTRFLTVRRDKLLMKLGCWLVIFSLVLGLMLPQQRAEALVAELTIGSVAALAASYLCACGLPLVTQGMDRDALVSNVQRLIQEFLDTELGGITIQEWLGSVWDLTVLAGKLIMGRPLTEEFADFAQWVAQKYATQAGENVVYRDSSFTVKLADGTDFFLSECTYVNNHLESLISLGTRVELGSLPLVFASGYYIAKNEGEASFSFFTPAGSRIGPSHIFLPYFYLGFDVNNAVFLVTQSSDKPVCFYTLRGDDALQFLGFYTVADESFSIDRSESMSYIPEGIEAEQGIALDVGAAATMDLDMVLQGVLDDVIAGELTSTMEAAGEAVVDPPADEITDVDNLGLPALGRR